MTLSQFIQAVDEALQDEFLDDEDAPLTLGHLGRAYITYHEVVSKADVKVYEDSGGVSRECVVEGD